ncbi:hypothetical protein MC885_017232 [Smutsia gigantea]|nr:hypothetical protein MC885_017232 [Smutsia gigantea]
MQRFRQVPRLHVKGQVALNETGTCRGPFVTAPAAAADADWCMLPAEAHSCPTPGSVSRGFLVNETGEKVLPSLVLRLTRCLDPLFWGWNQLSPFHHDQSHLPEVLPDCTSSAAPVVKTVEECSGLANGQPQYVMQVSAKDGQLLSTVVRTLATQR